MRIIAVDDDEPTVRNILEQLRRVEPDAEIIGFTKPLDAFNYLAQNWVDIAFLDIEMSELSGIEFARECSGRYPNINIIFATGHSQYAVDAFKLHVSGYLMKPVSEVDLRAELCNLRHPILPPLACRVRIQTFGNFEVFVDQKPLVIPIAKCRECLAYLVDRKGARVTAAELATVLWEDTPYDKRVQNNTHRVISDTMKYLRNAEIAEIVIKTRGEMAINTEKVDCDYYHFLKGDLSQINVFHGEYMTNYSWAEFTLGELFSARKTD